MQRASLTWRIPDFMQQQGRLVSPDFESGQPACTRKLRLKVHPHGDGIDNCVSAFLASDFEEDGPGMLVQFTIELLDQAERCRRPGHVLAGKKELSFSQADWGWKEFVSHEYLQANADRFLVGGAVVFKVDVTWLEKLAAVKSDE
ncbi:hypothetical protein ABPG75_013217 [Micractinium tetrahymenae]